MAVLLRGRRCLRPAHQQGGVPRFSSGGGPVGAGRPVFGHPPVASRPHAGRPGPSGARHLPGGAASGPAGRGGHRVRRAGEAPGRRGGAQGACPGGHGPGPCVHVLVRVFVPHGLAGGVEHAHLAARLPGHGRSIGHGRVGGADRRAERGRGGGAPVRLGSAGRRCCGVGAVCGIRFRLGHGRGRAGVAVLGRGGGVRRRPAYGVWLGYGQAS